MYPKLMFGLLAVAASALVATGSAAGGTRFDTSMLQRWTPNSRAEMRAEIPYALAHLAKAWLLVGDQKRAGRLLDEIERRGDTVYQLGYPWAPFPRVSETPNPADTIYTIDVAVMAEPLRQGHRPSFQHALALLLGMPLTSGGGCVADDAYTALAGCVHDINAYVLALYSRAGVPYGNLLAYEESTQLPDGSWWFWEEAPLTGMYSRSVEDVGHLSGSTYELLTSPDPRVRELGHRAAVYLETRYTGPSESPFWAYPTVLQAEIADGYLPACDMVGTLPDWANEHPTASSIAAEVFTWAQAQCPVWRPGRTFALTRFWSG